MNKIVEGDKLWKEYNLKEEKNRVYYYVEEILEMTKDDGTIKKGDKMKNEQIIKNASTCTYSYILKHTYTLTFP